jgi:hypothetical protein
MGNRLAVCTVVALALFGLSACYRSPDVDLHSPGVYKGPSDPLLKVEGTQAQQQRLQQRFRTVQMDR